MQRESRMCSTPLISLMGFCRGMLNIWYILTASAQSDQVILPLVPLPCGLNCKICYFGLEVPKEAGMIVVMVKLHGAVKDKSCSV